jgi:hypothetical protein
MTIYLNDCYTAKEKQKKRNITRLLQNPKIVWQSFFATKKMTYNYIRQPVLSQIHISHKQIRIIYQLCPGLYVFENFIFSLRYFWNFLNALPL